MIYDIRTTELARQTLCSLTDVSTQIWEENIERERNYELIDDFVEDIVNSYGVLPKNYKDFTFVYFHITTSANHCSSFRKHGILDLVNSYQCEDSELRRFLEDHGIHIDLNERILTYKNKSYNIDFGTCPRHDTLEYKCWSVGRKFFYDFTTCGFLSIWDKSPYGGYVHFRPEILMNIDALLGLDLSHEWAATHSPYEIVAQVSGKNILYDGYDESSDKDKVLDYLTRAYLTAFGEPTEQILLLKNGIQIHPSNIIEINPINYWV